MADPVGGVLGLGQTSLDRKFSKKKKVNLNTF
jgi:hypothetical protein